MKCYRKNMTHTVDTSSHQLSDSSSTNELAASFCKASKIYFGHVSRHDSLEEW